MEEWTGYTKGINLGGWFSQCKHTEDHYRSFIHDSDFERIHSWGCDHVRVPIDYELLEDNEGHSLENGFSYIQKVTELCRRNGLKIILDLHKTFGYSFDPEEKETGFFQSKKYQNRFYHLWETIARRFGDQSDILAFELLNEVTNQAYSETWNEVASECISRIRSISPKVFILVGGYGYNSVNAIKDLLLPVDERIVYNFHCYEPIIFTHQGAYWIPSMDPGFRISIHSNYRTFKMNTDSIMPGRSMGFDCFSAEEVLGSSYFENLFSEAVSIAKERNIHLYCGEYGVIDRVDPEEILLWYKMIHPVFDKYRIGRAAWSYKKMDFGISDKRMDRVRDELVSYL